MAVEDGTPREIFDGILEDLKAFLTSQGIRFQQYGGYSLHFIDESSEIIRHPARGYRIDCSDDGIYTIFGARSRAHRYGDPRYRESILEAILNEPALQAAFSRGNDDQINVTQGADSSP